MQFQIKTFLACLYLYKFKMYNYHPNFNELNNCLSQNYRVNGIFGSLSKVIFSEV
jgi:hypothetical protein